MKPEPPVIAYLFTTFPKTTETFMQREVIAMLTHGVRLRIYSMWGGEKMFRGVPITRFQKWKLLTLLWMIPIESLRRPEVLRQLLKGLLSRRPPSWINFWENMLGAGFACLYAGEFRRNRPDHIHAPWGGAPATAAWLLWRLDGHRFSAAAHAYDIYEHGGDWWLKDKLEHAQFIHTSTEMGLRSLIEHGLDSGKIHCIRRGLDQMPRVKPLRSLRDPLRLLCVARLVEKKGLRHQLRIYAALKNAGIQFTVRIVGDGPLKPELERLAGSLGVASQISFTGHLPHNEVWDQLEWADVLLHSGVIAQSGDRDGLPNVIPEAMSIGVVVVTSPAAATTEAVSSGHTGLVAAVDVKEEWVEALREISRDDEMVENLRTNARQWVEENFDAHKNAKRLLAQFDRVIKS
uniref:glycosyltransferase family 4 protein n=1 Tax=Cephaloticoccus sp. TaxID=1985742 RepID=UPI00404B0909